MDLAGIAIERQGEVQGDGENTGIDLADETSD
jgi:hypothetical protein